MTRGSRTVESYEGAYRRRRPDGVTGDRVLYVLDARGQMFSARTKPLLLGHHASFTADGEVLVDGLPWGSSTVSALIDRAAGPGARLVRADGPERSDILPLLVVTDGALAAGPRPPTFALNAWVGRSGSLAVGDHVRRLRPEEAAPPRASPDRPLRRLTGGRRHVGVRRTQRPTSPRCVKGW